MKLRHAFLIGMFVIGSLLLASAVYGVTLLSVPQGGTGLGSISTGDILTGTSTNVMAGLPIGTDGKVLTSNGTRPVWSSPTSTFSSMVWTNATGTNVTTTNLYADHFSLDSLNGFLYATNGLISTSTPPDNFSASGTAGQVAYFTSATSVQSNAGLAYVSGTQVFTVGSSSQFKVTAGNVTGTRFETTSYGSSSTPAFALPNRSGFYEIPTTQRLIFEASGQPGFAIDYSGWPTYDTQIIMADTADTETYGLTRYKAIIQNRQPAGLLINTNNSTLGAPMILYYDTGPDRKDENGQSIEVGFTSTDGAGHVFPYFYTAQPQPFGFGNSTLANYGLGAQPLPKMVMATGTVATNHWLGIGYTVNNFYPDATVDVTGDINATEGFWVGATTTASAKFNVSSSGNISTSGTLQLFSSLLDSAKSVGTSGQLLSSTGTSTRWMDGVSLSAANAWSVTNTFPGIYVTGTASRAGYIKFLSNGFGADAWMGPILDGTSVFGIGTIGSDPIHFFPGGVRKLSIGASGLSVGGYVVPDTNNSADLGSSSLMWRDAYLSNSISVGTSTAACTTGMNKDGGTTLTMWNMSGGDLPLGTVVETVTPQEVGDPGNNFDRYIFNGVTTTIVVYPEIQSTMLPPAFSTTTFYLSSATSTSNAIGVATTTNIYGQNFWMNIQELNGSGINGSVYVTAMLMNSQSASASWYIVLPGHCTFKKSSMASQVPIGCLATAATASSTAPVTISGVGRCIVNSNNYAIVGGYGYTASAISGGMVDASTNYTNAKIGASESMMGYFMESLVGDGVKAAKMLIKTR